MTRAVAGHPSRPITRITVRIPGCRSATNTVTSRSSGMLRIASINRDSTVSATPRK
jgi:hypothetical protein